jgi:hypothetical protein
MRRAPLEPDRPTSDPLWEGFLEDGDALYLPRGCWHEASAVGGPSLHLTIGIRRRTGVDFLRWLAAELRATPAIRRDLPRFAGEGDLESHAQELRTAVLGALTDEAITSFLRDNDAAAPAVPETSLPWSVLPAPLGDGQDAVVKLIAPRAVLEHQDDGIALSADRRRWRFHPSVAPILELMLDGQPRPVRELQEAAPAVKPEAVVELLAELVVDGLLSADY